MLELSITNEQKVKVTITPKTDAGKPAKLDGAPQWSVASGEAIVQPSDDGLSADLVSSDNPGDSEILITADADLGSGVVTISDAITLHVLGASAKNLGLTAGQPVTK